MQSLVGIGRTGRLFSRLEDAVNMVNEALGVAIRAA
jgi:hypothetical protein